MFGKIFYIYCKNYFFSFLKENVVIVVCCGVCSVVFIVGEGVVFVVLLVFVVRCLFLCIVVVRGGWGVWCSG